MDMNFYQQYMELRGYGMDAKSALRVAREVYDLFDFEDTEE